MAAGEKSATTAGGGGLHYLPYIAIVVLGMLVYFAARSTVIGDALGFKALGEVRAEWNKVEFGLQIMTVLAIAVVSAALGPMLESVSIGRGVAMLAIWSIVAILSTVVLLSAAAVAIDFVPAIALPALVFLRAMSRQMRRRDRALFVKEMHALQEHQLFRSVLENPYEGIVVANWRGEIVYANRVGMEMFGREEQEMVGLKVDELNPTLWQGRIGQPFTQMLAMASDRRAQVGPFESSGMRRDGTSFPMSVVVGVCPIGSVDHPMERRRGERLFFICHLVDITARQELVQGEPQQRAIS
ncbi:MAG TPA: PAS domain S-box protein [Alphaproteobacteria bacterium]|nr:PAS domain S-box protein [Alphaproteobacteria bacterium]